MNIYEFVFGYMPSTYYATGRTLEEALKKAQKRARKELNHPVFRSAKLLGELA
jgi:hypothetical protein